MIFFFQTDRSIRQEHQVSTGSGGYREREREAKKRAAIGNTVRGLLSSGHSRQDRYNDVCIKNHAFYIDTFIFFFLSFLCNLMFIYLNFL